MKKAIKLISTILSIFLILSFRPCNLVVFAATLGTEAKFRMKSPQPDAA